MKLTGTLTETLGDGSSQEVCTRNRLGEMGCRALLLVQACHGLPGSEESRIAWSLHAGGKPDGYTKPQNDAPEDKPCRWYADATLPDALFSGHHIKALGFAAVPLCGETDAPGGKERSRNTIRRFASY